MIRNTREEKVIIMNDEIRMNEKRKKGGKKGATPDSYVVTNLKIHNTQYNIIRRYTRRYNIVYDLCSEKYIATH